jgi:hypothetical protein
MHIFSKTRRKLEQMKTAWLTYELSLLCSYPYFYYCNAIWVR